MFLSGEGKELSPSDVGRERLCSAAAVAASAPSQTRILRSQSY